MSLQVGFISCVYNCMLWLNVIVAKQGLY